MRLLKRRYVGYKIRANKHFSKYEVRNLLSRELQTLNQNNTIKTYFKILEHDRESGLGIIRSDHKSVEKILFQLNRISEEKTEDITFIILRVSGTLKALRRKILT